MDISILAENSQSRFLFSPFCMFRRILHTIVNVQNPSVSIPLFNPPHSKPPHCESGRTLLRAKKTYSIVFSLLIARIVLHPKESWESCSGLTAALYMSFLNFESEKERALWVSCFVWLIQFQVHFANQLMNTTYEHR